MISGMARVGFNRPNHPFKILFSVHQSSALSTCVFHSFLVVMSCWAPLMGSIWGDKIALEEAS